MTRSWLRRTSMAALLASFMPGPTIGGLGQAGINVFDTLFLFSTFLFLIDVCLKRSVFLRLNGLSLIGLLYPLLVVSVSLLGVLVNSYPLVYSFGDLRWLQAIVMSVMIFHSYREGREVLSDMKYIIFLGLIMNGLFVFLQTMAATGAGVHPLLEWWYKDVPESASRPLGFHINRFSGATGQPSGLGFFAALSIGYALVALKKSSAQLFILVGACLLLIASGTRTAMVATVFVIVVYLTFLAGRHRAKYLLYTAIVTMIAIPLALETDLGGIGTSGRYQALVEIATGDMEYHAASKRGDAWGEAISRRNNDHSYLGTLSNPSRVYDELIIDSGYLHVFVRLGPLGIFFLGIMLATPTLMIISGKRSRYVSFAFIVFSIILVVSINQNTFTGLNIKNIVIFSIFLISQKNRENEYIGANKHR